MEKNRDNQDFENVVSSLRDRALEGQGSEGLQGLEYFNAASDQFLYYAQQLHGGEGESLEVVVENLQNSIKESSESLTGAVTGTTADARIESALTLLRDLDNRAIEAVGPDNALYANLSNEELFTGYERQFQQVVDQSKAGSDEEVDLIVGDNIESLVESWHIGLVTNVNTEAEPNTNDVIKEKQEKRREARKTFARDVGKVALGTLPVIGAMFLFGRKGK